MHEKKRLLGVDILLGQDRGQRRAGAASTTPSKILLANARSDEAGRAQPWEHAAHGEMTHFH
jgi:hypothetical protein